MKGYQISFFTLQNTQHEGKRLTEWLMDLAKELGLRGVTEMSVQQGFGRQGKLHSAHFFELADQPVELLVAVTEGQSARLFERLKIAKVKVFYVKTEVEFGSLGDTSD